jgi:perosamine synthetase
MNLSAPKMFGNELKYIEDVLTTTRWASGKYVEKLEREVSEYVGCKYAVATNSGTSALHISLLINGIGEGDRVIVPTLTFIAPVNAVRYAGAEPIFIDCDKYGNMDVEKLQQYLIDDKYFHDNHGRVSDIKAILPVHLLGGMCDIHSIFSLAEEYGLNVIEDSAESFGSKIKNDAYAGTIGDCGIYSFNANKIITGGSGGMIITNNDVLACNARYLINQAKSEAYMHDVVGYNYSMSDITASILYSQFEHIDSIIEHRKAIYDLYKENLNMLEYPDYVEPNYWFNSLICDNPDEIKFKLYENGIESRRLWSLCHQQRPYRDCSCDKIEKAQYLYDHVLNIPSGNDITLEDAKKVISVIKK